jgi:chromosome segregation ATPase
LIESAIYASVGFLIAALLALMAAPALSRRATRLAVARARLLSPLSETQARAERDALRGQHAVEITRIEQRLRALEDSRAAALAELGRRAIQIIRFEEDTAEKADEIARQRAEIAGLDDEVRDRGAEIGAREIALRDLTNQRDVAEQRLADSRARVARRDTTILEHLAEITRLTGRVAALELDLAELRRLSALAARAAKSEQERLTAALTERTNAAAALGGELGTARARLSALLVELDGRESEAAELRRRLLEVEPRLAAVQSSGENLAIENARQLHRIAEREAAFERAEALHREAAKQMAEQYVDARAREDALSTDLKAATTRLAAVEGALGAARAERGELQGQVDQLRARSAEASSLAQGIAKGDKALRQAIARLGREIASGGDPPPEDEPAAAQIVNFTRREPLPRAEPAEDVEAQEQAFASER